MPYKDREKQLAYMRDYYHKTKNKSAVLTDQYDTAVPTALKLKSNLASSERIYENEPKTLNPKLLNPYSIPIEKSETRLFLTKLLMKATKGKISISEMTSGIELIYKHIQ